MNKEWRKEKEDEAGGKERMRGYGRESEKLSNVNRV